MHAGCRLREQCGAAMPVSLIKLLLHCLMRLATLMGVLPNFSLASETIEEILEMDCKEEPYAALTRMAWSSMQSATTFTYTCVVHNALQQLNNLNNFKTCT